MLTCSKKHFVTCLLHANVCLPIVERIHTDLYEASTRCLQCLPNYALHTYPVLQPLRWCCIECVIHHERDVREEQHHSYMWREQAIIEWSWHVNSIVACCHSAKLCAYAARDFRSQHQKCISVRLHQISHCVRTFGALFRNNLCSFLQRCVSSANFYLNAFNV